MNKRQAKFNKLPPSQRLGDAPVEEQYHQRMEETVRGLDILFNGCARGNDRKVGFILMVFPFNSHDGRCNYMSNGANRQDVVVLMKEMIARFEGRPETHGAA